MNKYPMKGMMDQAATHGRFGDTMLLHVNPAELEGIAALSPTGKLTTNPVTGQPEAFLPMLIPLLASWGGTAAAGAMGASAVGAAVAGGLASGVATGAITGDWERGLASGVMGAGLGGALANSGMAGEAALQGVDAAVPQAVDMSAVLTGAESLASTAPEMVDMSAALAGGVDAGMGTVSAAEAGDLMNLLEGGDGLTGVGDIGVTGTKIGLPGSAPDAPWYGDWSESGRAGFGGRFKENLGAPFQDGSGLGKNLMAKQALMPMAMGAGSLMQADTQDKWERQAEKLAGNNEEVRQDTEDRMMAAYRRAQPDLPWDSYSGGGITSLGIARFPDGGFIGRGDASKQISKDIQTNLRGKYAVSPTDKSYAPDQYEYGADQYEIAKTRENYADDQWEYGDDNYYIPDHWINPTNEHRAHIRKEFRDQWEADPRGILIPGTIPSRLRLDAVANPDAQSTLIDNPQGTLIEGAVGTSQNPNFRHGYDPEFDFFQNDPNNVQVPESTDWSSVYKPFDYDMGGLLNKGNFPSQRFDPSDRNSYPPDSSWTWDEEEGRWKQGMAAGGDVTLNTDLGTQTITGGGIAQVPTPYTEQPQQQAQPTEQDVQMVAAALTGQAGEQADQIIDMFIQKFGNEMFTQIRRMILQSMEPNAQTEGMIQGQGGGMDDMVHGTIGGQQPVAVSPGEYIVPADVVSGVGDGSSDAGAQELDAMMDRVRMARGGTTNQPAPFDARKVLPR